MPDTVTRTDRNHLPRCPRCKARLRKNIKQETICSCFNRYRWTETKDPNNGETSYQRIG